MSMSRVVCGDGNDFHETTGHVFCWFRRALSVPVAIVFGVVYCGGGRRACRPRTWHSILIAAPVVVATCHIHDVTHDRGRNASQLSVQIKTYSSKVDFLKMFYSLTKSVQKAV